MWKVEALPRIQSFVWLCSHNSIGVKECLVRRGVSTDPTCPLCHRVPKSILHALRDCEVVKSFWLQLRADEISSGFFSEELQIWLKKNGTSKIKRGAN